MNNDFEGNILKFAREIKDFRIIDVANALDISESSLKKYEESCIVPKLEVLVSLCLYLDIDLNDYGIKSEYIENKNKIPKCIKVKKYYDEILSKKICCIFTKQNKTVFLIKNNNEYILINKITYNLKQSHLPKELQELYVHNIIGRSLQKEFNINNVISIEKYLKTVSEPCYYCGNTGEKEVIIKTKNSENKIFKYNGIDRLDNELGYVNNNIVSCCSICNYMKGQLSVNQFVNKCQDIVNKVKKEL